VNITWCFSKFAIFSLLALSVLTGCAANKLNYESSSEFRLYVSKERYRLESCENLERMYQELIYSGSPYEVARKHLGLGPFQYKIAERFEDQLLADDFRYISEVLEEKCET